MEYSDGDLKLIYVLKVGYDSKYNGLYEFIFSINETNVDVEKWGWDLSPACNYAQPPEEEFVNRIINLKTSDFDLFCLHEAVDREYMHGYHTIHALAYENYATEEVGEDGGGFSSYEDLFEKEVDDDNPLLVFHYGTTLKQIKEMLYERGYVLRGNDFLLSSKIEIK
jgi:hypothetical protein